MKQLLDFLEWTAWPMEEWHVFGPEHIVAAVLGITAAVAAGIVTAKREALPENEKRTGNFMRTVYMSTGLILLVSEIYKQLFNYYIVNGQQYVWDLLPFQLCSMPMYLCLWIPWVRSEKLRLCLNTFLIDFNVMGAVMVFADPSGIFHRYWTLTLHGVLWHLLILFAGVYAGVSGKGAHQNMRGFWQGIPVFLVSCAMAVGINVLVHPYGNANMFYINLYEPSIQIVFRDIAARLGTAAGNISYFFAMMLGAAVVHWIFVCMYQKISFLYKRHCFQDEDPQRQCYGRQ